ncbi:MAG: tetratricopeptide repeat protein, partial [Chloroflexi bacterium]|nr:tetratricopeptide repeat protein [Chloroflexota bacterium]MCI0650142.1 tetratricopeptide repeat protein [Chloroflexota bacterium]MCI0731383.1 tetratricopeptide repeat protein [Chloroflexota bacterium]
ATESTRLAHHWSAAGNRLKEAHYAALAGDQALSVGANSEAKALFEQAITALRRLPATTQYQQQFIDNVIKMSRVAAYLPGDEIPGLLQEALQTAESLADEVRLAHVLSALGANYYMSGQLAQAFQYFDRCTALAEKLQLDRLLLLPYNMIGRALLNTGNYPQGAGMLAKGIQLAEKFGDLELLAGSLVFYASALWQQGKHAEGVPYAARAMAVANQLGHPSRIAGNLMVIGFSHAFCGRFDEAIDYLTRCLAIASDIQALHPLFTAHGCLGYIYLQLDEIAKASYHLDECLALTGRYKQLSTYVPMYHGYQAELVMRQGRWRDALSQAEAALNYAERDRQVVAQGQVQQTLARILIAGPDPDWPRAEQLIRDTIGLYERGNGQTFVVAAWLELAKLYAGQGLSGQARAILDQVIEKSAEFGMLWQEKYARQLQAML